MESLGRYLILFGITIILFGLLLIFFQKLGFGKLPGDIFIKRGNMTIIFPLASSIIISVLLSVILRFFKK